MQSKNNIIIILLVVLIALLAYFAFLKPKSANDNFQIPAGDTANEKDDENSYKNINQNDNLEILGNKDDLVSFSLTPGQKVSGKMTVTGSVKGEYFFEGEMGFGISGQKIIKIPTGPTGFARATTDWMTAGPVAFEAVVDFSNFSKGPAFINIGQNDPSDGESGKLPKTIQIPIVIK